MPGVSDIHSPPPQRNTAAREFDLARQTFLVACRRFTACPAISSTDALVEIEATAAAMDGILACKTDGTLVSITPSGFHDQAYRRDAGHDVMQQAFLEWLRTRPIANLPPRSAVHRTVEGEYPLWRHGQIVAYADACEVLTVNLTTTISLFEIKPRIHTVYGCVRQAKALEALAKSVEADFHFCHIVVKADDPLLVPLRAEWPRVWAWGIIFEPVEPDDA